MLKNIPPVLSPDLVHTLMSMGHGDTLVIADSNFPASSVAAANNHKLIPAYGLGVTDILEGIMQLFPLDKYDPNEAFLVMQVVPGDKNSPERPPIWEKFESIIKKEEDWAKLVEVERFQFYEKAKTAYAVIATSETAIYANIILKKGVVHPK